MLWSCEERPTLKLSNAASSHHGIKVRDLLRSEQTRASEPKKFLTNRATESNPSLPHPAVATRRLRLTMFQSTCATSVRTTLVCTSNRRNRMCHFDRGSAGGSGRRLRVGTINFTKTEIFWNSYGWLISFLLKKKVLVHGLLGHHTCLLTGVVQIFQNETPTGEENAFTS